MRCMQRREREERWRGLDSRERVVRRLGRERGGRVVRAGGRVVGGVVKGASQSQRVGVGPPSGVVGLHRDWAGQDAEGGSGGGGRDNDADDRGTNVDRAAAGARSRRDGSSWSESWRYFLRMRHKIERVNPKP